MAAALNSAKSKKFKKKLDDLGCPYTEGVEDSWIAELLFKPGESRIRLLQWLFSKFDSKLNEILDPQYASVESKMDSRIQRLLFVASNLGLCRYDDVDLIRGVVPASKQSAFMEHLIDVVDIADKAEDPKNKLFREAGVVSEAMSLEEQLSHDCAYLNALCSHGNIDSIFSTKVTLLPPDLQKKVESRWSQGGKSTDKAPKPDLQSIEAEAIQLGDDMARQVELLQDLKKHYDYQPTDDSKLETICKTISLVVSELSQLVTGFTYCYENEMKHWCNKSPPNLTQLGPAFKRVHRLLQQFVQLLQNLRAIRASYTALNRDTAEIGQQMPGQHDTSLTLVGVGEEALNSLQDVVDVLEESIQNSEVVSSAQTTPRSVRSRTSQIPSVQVSPRSIRSESSRASTLKLES
ncbi:HAUS augmin-like complex subunit 7 [Ruditapes philippinarum]|uniref:HAUS augmin-like complex subunit 7 n=1 Tax=Ruditapes philippinarum TaxID=129788 RepID=UPI00295A96DA|nr:HAUS augmin-like complex subunit 7 [Ruditapes philippinarum]